MRRILLASPFLLLLASCGGQGESTNTENPAGKDLSEAAAQSDPAAAAAINQAQAQGLNEQQALAAGGRAAAANAQAAAANAAGGPVQARPNLPWSPNRKDDGRSPPDKMRGATNDPGIRQNGEQQQPQRSGGE
jgi:hypothetical protein